MPGYLNLPLCGDAKSILAAVPNESIDACVTDPPYGLTTNPNMPALLKAWLAGKPFTFGKSGFMSAEWDNYIPGPDIWKEVYRVLKPGAYALVFAGSRTQDLMGLALRLAGFEIKDTLIWCYSSGFPKSPNISKAIDKAAGAERPVVGTRLLTGNAAVSTKEKGGTYVVGCPPGPPKILEITGPATDDAKRWDGWGTSLKPANEPIFLAQKPFEGSYVENVLRHGTGALNIAASRVGDEVMKFQQFGRSSLFGNGGEGVSEGEGEVTGRWPANVILECICEDSKDGHGDCCPAAVLDEQIDPNIKFGASRYFKQIYHKKAPGSERWSWCETCGCVVHSSAVSDHEDHERTFHPTQKPVDLMRYLIKLVTQPGGVVLDPFGGAFSTAVAAKTDGYHFVSCDLMEAHVKIGEARLGAVGRADSDTLHVGAVLCPGCRDRGEIKMIEKAAIEHAKARARKVTCVKCLGRWEPEELLP